MNQASAPASAAASAETADQAGRYFRYMAEFIGFTNADVELIKRTKPFIEKHVPAIVAGFYSHLLRYPPTRRFFLKKDGTIDQAYVELRMRHLTNFWLRTATGVFDDEYARYVDYVGRAHTARGADPKIYIAERYVIGQVGFVQHAISEALIQELGPIDEDLEDAAVEAWDKLMMVILELLAHAYGHEREAETFDPLVDIDRAEVTRLATRAFETERGKQNAVPYSEVVVARATDIPDGERKIVQVGTLSIGVFHHKGNWYAVRNSCLHRGGPIAAGPLNGDILVCPWHGFQYNLLNGQLLVDPNARLEMYAVTERDGNVILQAPDHAVAPQAAAPSTSPELNDNQIRVSDLPEGQARLVRVGTHSVAVFNVGGALYATQEECTHAAGPLSEGTLQGSVITCPLHGSCFDVTTGAVQCGPAQKALKRYEVQVADGIASVSEKAA